ncbi:uncharacterized protein N0V89_006814 [Didymosphaeria variabile]|uniref:Uncharacterized protein n=1 Tax=Didymosphaeria variabile TaxID=1932322 RepID=A0A9W8XJP3_9PLEO|nr:uncharacterized protein N0V89_006814 [Didymosphaeria variabile]KAJ4351471.1 hypothetical protein N0V89_006814 [Didymosphaeria variabile]
MDLAARQKAIEGETLSNEEAIILLYTRRDYYASPDSVDSQALHAKLADLFEAAVLDAKIAVAAHDPVVKVLKKALLDTGRLLHAAKQAENEVSKGEKKAKSQLTTKDGAATRAVEVQAERESLARPTEHLSQSQQTSNQLSPQNLDVTCEQTQEIASVPASENLSVPQATPMKMMRAAAQTEGNNVERVPHLLQNQNNPKARHPESSREQAQKTAPAHLATISTKQHANANIAAPDSLSSRINGSLGAVSRSPNPAQHYAQEIVRTQQLRIQQRAQADKQGNDDTNMSPLPPSCSVSPSRPLSSMQASMSTSIATSSPAAAFTSAFAPAKRPPPTPPKAPAPKRRNTTAKGQEPTRKNRRKKLHKSDKLVVESEDSDAEMKDSNTITPSKVGAIDPSEGLTGFENFDENGNYMKKPHARLLLENGELRGALIVKLKLSPEKLQEVLDRNKNVAEPKKLRLRLKVQPSTPRTSASYHTSAAPNAGLFSTRPEPGIASDDEDAAWESGEEMTATAHIADVTFPPFPVLSAAHLNPFMKGLITAIENVITDHADRPEASLLELVKQLDEEKPTLPAGFDERRIVLNGGEYVYAAVHQLCGDAVQEKDAAKESGVDADVDSNTSVTSSTDVNTNMSVSMDAAADVKLTDSNDGKGITPLPEKAYYKGKGRAWKKTPNDADPAFHTQTKISVSSLPKRVLSRRKATRGGRKDSWKEDGVEELFALFRAHVKKEYWFQAGRLGGQT